MSTAGVRHLTKAENYKLAEHVRAHYTASGQSDIEFAAAAGATLGFALSARHIMDARAIFDIANNRLVQAEQRKAERAAKADPTRVAVEELQARLDAMEAALREYGFILPRRALPPAQAQQSLLAAVN